VYDSEMVLCVLLTVRWNGGPTGEPNCEISR